MALTGADIYSAVLIVPCLYLACYYYYFHYCLVGLG